MKELLEYVAQQLVDEPDKVDVQLVQGERSMILELRVAANDQGKVIGKQGKIAQALRTLVKAAGLKDGKRVIVEIL